MITWLLIFIQAEDPVLIVMVCLCWAHLYDFTGEYSKKIVQESKWLVTAQRSLKKEVFFLTSWKVPILEMRFLSDGEDKIIQV